MRLGQLFDKSGDTQESVIAFELGFKALTADSQLDLTDEFESMFRVSVGKSYQYVPLSKTVNVSPDLYTPQSEQDLSKASQDPHIVIKLLIHIGNAYLEMGQTQPAADRYHMALDRPDINATPDLEAIIYTHLGLIKLRQDKTDSAADLLEAALTAFKKAQQTPIEQRKALNVLASLRYKQGKIDEAINLYQDARNLYQQAKDPLGEQRALVNLGHIWLKQEDWDLALQTFSTALKCQPKQIDKQALSYIHWGLGQCQIKQNDIRPAIQSYEHSLALIRDIYTGFKTDEGKVAYLDSVQEVYDGLIIAWLKLAEKDSRLYSNLLDVIDRARAGAFKDMLESRKRIKRQSSTRREPERFNRPFEQIAQTAMHISDTPISFDLDEVGVPNSSAIDMLPPFFGSSDGENQTDKTEVPMREPHHPRPMGRLVYYVLPHKLIILSVSVDGKISGHVHHISEEELTHQITNLLSALEATGPMSDSATRRIGARPPDSTVKLQPIDFNVQLKQLYQDLVAPVNIQLPTDGTPLIIEPHGSLWLLPFAALIDPAGNYLADSAPLLTVPAYPILDVIRSEPDYGPPEQLHALIVGKSEFADSVNHDGVTYMLEPLQNGTKEAESIGRLFKSTHQTLILNQEATVNRVAQALNHHQIIHLATHGIAFTENPNQSFLVFEPDHNDDKNGLLNVYDVTDQSIEADLVTLSACQTGLGKISGDGMLGLGRAFLAVGARSVIVSQWNVSDRATAELMHHFYRYYIQLDDKAIALNQAMKDLRKKPEFNHPKYWASFTLIGAEM